MDHPQFPWEFKLESIHDAASHVGGAVINGTDSQLWIILVQQRPQALLDVLAFIPRRDYYGYRRGLRPCWRGVPFWIGQAVEPSYSDGCDHRASQPIRSENKSRS